MKAPLSWLKDFLPLTAAPEDIAQTLTMLGIEVEKISEDSSPIFDLSLTPNLGHCLSMLGISRELAAAYKMTAKRPTIALKITGNIRMSVEISDPKLCPRYACRLMTGIQVAPSPEWMQKRLLACGIRPINNVVDVSNYVMLEVGQPLHIFDADKVQDQKIVISPTTEPLSFETLDGQKRDIPPSTLLIRDGKKPLAIAGIMGGLSSAASEKTQTILIESSSFDAASIRRSSRRLDLKTDGSSRHERGIDRGSCILALDRAAALIQEISGGDIHPLVDIASELFIPRIISCRLPRLQQLLGFPLSLGEVVSLLERLEMTVTASEPLEVTIPTYRNDLQQEIDLVEEVARLFGYNHIPQRRPYYTGSELPDAPIYILEKTVRNLLLKQGLQECITCDLISPEHSELTLEKGMQDNSTIRVLHPRSIDQSVLRTSLLPGLLQVAKLNSNYQTNNISAFEVGRIHFRDKETLKEASCAAMILTGLNRPLHFDRKPSELDFFDLKGIVENLCNELRLIRYTFEPSHLHTLHPWRQARLKCGDVTIGILGEVHPQLILRFDIPARLFFAELNLHDILPLKKNTVEYSKIPSFPSILRDWTVTLKESLPIQVILQTIDSVKSPLLADFYLFDLFISEQLGAENKNATFRFVYQSPTKTLDDEIVKQEHEKLTHSVARNLEQF